MKCDCCGRRKKFFESFAAIKTKQGTLNLCVECNDLIYKIRDASNDGDVDAFEENKRKLNSRNKKATSSFLTWKETFIAKLQEKNGAKEVDSSKDASSKETCSQGNENVNGGAEKTGTTD